MSTVARTLRPARPRRRKPKRHFPAEVLTREEAAALLAACDAATCVGLRNRALIALMYRSGLRIAEALSVRPKDVDVQNCAIRVLFAKGGKARTVGIDPGALDHVAAWAARRQEWGVPPGASLFCSSSGRRLTAAYVRRLLPCLARRAGIERRVHAHGLRHTMASQLREEGVDIGLVRVLWAKGGKARTVGIDPAALELVTAWAAALFLSGPRVRAPCTRRSTTSLDAAAPERCAASAERAGTVAGAPCALAHWTPARHRPARPQLTLAGTLAFPSDDQAPRSSQPTNLQDACVRLRSRKRTWLRRSCRP